MKNPIRRNRNIGTSKQGWRRQSKFGIPDRISQLLIFYENLSEHSTVEKIINSQKLLFIVEHTRKDHVHACTVDDISFILSHLDQSLIDDLRFIVLRQPKKKEKIFSSVWGRLIYSYTYKKESAPAIILEAGRHSIDFTFPKKQSIERQREFEHLKNDGIRFEEDKRNFKAFLTLSDIRNVQLYRTLLHEIGHYNQYLDYVDRPVADLKRRVNELKAKIDWEQEGTDPIFDEWDKMSDQLFEMEMKNWEAYDNVPSIEKETYANRFAIKVAKELQQKNAIPFERICSPDSMKIDGIRMEDFDDKKSG